MVVNEKKKVRLKGNESFFIRDGWLRKGIKNILIDNTVFTRKDAAEILGVGVNMVKSIKYWLKASGLVKDAKNKNKTYYELTKLGEIINKYDPYFEDIFTWWIIHFNISSNFQDATVWYLFYNLLEIEKFNKDDLFIIFKSELEKIVGSGNFSESSLKDDINCLLRSYYFDHSEETSPEDNLISPLASLNLIYYKNGYYFKNKPDIRNLHPFAILYVIIKNMDKEKKQLDFNHLIYGECNIGKIFNMDINMVNEYIEILHNLGIIEVNRTAGLNKIYIKNDEIINNELSIIEKYYTNL